MKLPIIKKYIYIILLCILFVSFCPPENDLSKQKQTATKKEQIDFNFKKIKSEFEDLFNSEDISNITDTSSNLNEVYFKSKLPEWVLNLPHSTDSVFYAIGISDPGMRKDSAFQLAILRAKTISSILSNSKMNGLSEYYINEKDLKNGDIVSSVYNEFVQIVSNITFDTTNFKIIEEAFTSNNEAIVLSSLHLNKRPFDDSRTIHCLAEISGSYIKRNNKYSSTSRTHLMTKELGNMKNLNPNFYYVVKKLNKKALLLSNFSGVSIPKNTKLLTYESTDHLDENEKNFHIECTLQKGFWYAFFSVLFQTLVSDFQESNVKQSSLTDYNTNLLQDINRLFSEKNVSLRLKHLHIQNNKLQLETDFIIQD